MDERYDHEKDSAHVEIKVPNAKLQAKATGEKADVLVLAIVAIVALVALSIILVFILT